MALALFLVDCTDGLGKASPEDSISFAAGVWWPWAPASSPAPGPSTHAALRREVRAQLDPSPATLHDWLVRAASIGDLDLVIELAQRRLADRSDDVVARSALGAALLARGRGLDRDGDFLDGLDALARLAEPAARCNLAAELAALGLERRAAAVRRSCPINPRGDAVPGRSAPPSGPLTDAERVRADALVVAGQEEVALATMRARASAWRAFFEEEGLETWVDSLSSVASRRRAEERLARWAALYGRATGNPLPSSLVSELAAVPRDAVAAVAEAVSRWLRAEEHFRAFEAEQAAIAYAGAAAASESYVPSLASLIEVRLVNNRYHLGDDRGMKEGARDLRSRLDCTRSPWICGRCWWLEASGTQAEADWDGSLARLDRAEAFLGAIAEHAAVGYLWTTRGIAYAWMGDDERADSAYLEALRRVSAEPASRYVAATLTVFSRHQGRVGRSALAIELQREAVARHREEGDPTLVHEALTILAEQLIMIGRTDQAAAALADAAAMVSEIPSAGSRRRSEGTWNQVHAQLMISEAPGRAVDSLTRYLDGIEAFGERHYRADALVARARAFAAMGLGDRAFADLEAAALEIADQGRRVRDRVAAVDLLDRSRNVLEELVRVDLGGGGESAARGWVERLRGLQEGRGFGTTADGPHGATWPELAEGICLTQYFSLDDALVLWSRCGSRQPSERVVRVARHDLADAMSAMREAAKRGSLEALRGAAAQLEVWLVKPQENQLASAVSWIVIPDARLPAIPYAWLTLEGTFLFEARAVAVARSWSTVEIEAKPLQVGGWRILAVADPASPDDDLSIGLPAAGDEALHMDTLFPGAQILLGEEATWSAIEDSAEEIELLHLAAHMSSIPRVPLSARLHLAPEAARPSGRVSPDDIAQLDLSDLVLAVLAACSSGHEDTTLVSGDLEVASSFLAAGVDTVVATLWDVRDDEISRSLATFYRGLADGLAAPQALRRTWSEALSHSRPGALAAASALQLHTATTAAEPVERSEHR